jgi:glutamate dehydrogenase/leucine dehydrogenase
MSQAIFWTAEEVTAKAEKIYQTQLRHIVETPENIGKMLVVDVETGEYAIDANGVESAMSYD